ncbi:MAG: hypothetical protein LC126_18410 [Bryobacterales bacterium]|nr:hypothetical protein [Bryobacterales bacterium]
MAWPKLRKSQATDREETKPKKALPSAIHQRLNRLARKLDELPAKDELRMRQARELEEKQRSAGAELHQLCRCLVDALNSILDNLKIEITPVSYNAGMLDSPAGLLIQINASGRIVQLAIHAREPEVSSEHFRTPYILRGAIRWFNQEFLERQEIQENQIFYCIDAYGGSWRYYDLRTRKTAAVDEDFIAGTLEQLL